MTTAKPSYEELEQRCLAAEGQLAAIRAGQADAILGEKGLLVLRLANRRKGPVHQKRAVNHAQS